MSRLILSVDNRYLGVSVNAIFSRDYGTFLSLSLEKLLDDKINNVIFSDHAPTAIRRAEHLDQMNMQCIVRKRVSSLYLSLRDILLSAGPEDIMQHILSNVECCDLMANLDITIDKSVTRLSGIRQCKVLMQGTLDAKISDMETFVFSLNLPLDKQIVALKPVEGMLGLLIRDIDRDFSGNVSVDHMSFEAACEKMFSVYSKVMCGGKFGIALDYINHVNPNHKRNVESFLKQLKYILLQKNKEFCQKLDDLGHDADVIDSVTASIKKRGEVVISDYMLKYDFFQMHETMRKLDIVNFDKNIKGLLDAMELELPLSQTELCQKASSCTRLQGVLSFNHPSFKKKLFEFPPVDRSLSDDEKKKAITRSIDFYKNYLDKA